MMPVAILCGGLGTRLGDETKHKPKSLVDVNVKPFIVHQLELLKRNGYTDIILLIAHLGYQISAALGDGSRFGVQLRYIDDGPYGRLGTLAAVRHALFKIVVKKIFVLYGDSYLDCDYTAIEHAFIQSGKSALRTEWKGVDYGLSAFVPAVFDAFESGQDLNAIHQWLRIHHDLAIYPMPRKWLEIGSPEGLAEVRAYLRASSTTESGATSP